MSKVIIKLDNSGNVILPTMVLATRSGKKLGTILTEENKLTASLENGYSLSFIVNKYLDGHENNVWDSIDNFKLLYIPDWDIWFEMYVSIAENSSIVKEVECTSLCEAELSQIMLYNIEINTETDISREDYEPTIIYNDKNPAASLLDRIMEKTPHYCIEHVDKSIAKLQRTFTFDGKSVRDAMHEVAEEINALLVLNSGSNLDGTITRGISLYDLEEHCEDCGYRGKSSNGQCPECGSVNWSYGYGEDSGIFISSENLSNDIKLTTDTDKIKNCFKLVAGDDLMTATVAGCCPNGIGYLWYLTEDTKNDMSAELRSRLDSYDRLTADIEKKHWTLSDSDYSALATKYGKEKWDSIDGYADLLNAMYDTIDFQLYLEHSMMPDTSIPETTAQEQMNKLVANLSPVAVQNLSVLSSTTATSYVAQAIRAIVDPRYSVTTSEETLNGNNWSGTIKLTRSSDETDTVTRQNVRVALNDDFVNYLKTLIDRTINTTKLEEFDIIALFDMSLTRFAGEIRKYSLTYLQTFYDAAQSCLNVLIERGAGNDSVSPEAYNTLYTNYYDKRETLQREITLREQEISTIEYKQNTIDRQINQVHDDLDLEKYLGEKLWLELAAYRREDTYKNDNFISDGLSNAELFEKAREFIERAKSDIENSNYGQHEITSSLYNLLLMPEFKKLYDGFALGNWLRIRVDGEIYLLRLIEYSLDFTNLQNINVVYSDVTEQNLFYNAAMDSESNYKSMASTYGNVSRQASHGNDSNKQLRSWVSDGLQATLTRFMSDAVNQNIMWDSNGLLFRRYDDITEDYSPEQLRIINSTIAVTDDNWKTVKTAVGGFDYLDPVTQKVKHGYGINAELLIGKLILGEELGLYNPNNSLTFDRNGLRITNGDSTFEVNPNAGTLLSITTGDHQLLWLDDEGNLHLNVFEFKLSTGDTIEDVANDVLEQFKKEIYDPEIEALSDSKIETWYQSTDPSTTSEWRNSGESKEEADNRHEGDIWYDTVNQVYKRWNGTKWEDSPSVPPADMIEKWDGKKQIFYCDPNDADESKRHPNPPYDLNDLWVQGANGDILRCQEAKTKEQSYEADDWAKASKYTDDTNITAYVNTIKDTLQGQVDKKIETYYQTEDPSAGWSESEKSLHIGDIWYSIEERIYKRWTGSIWEPTPSEPPEDLLDKWDKKKQIFYCDPNDANPANRHPNPPYWINDLWVQGDGGDILVCKDTRLEGDYISTDWQKACKYTDDTEITKYVNEEIERLQKQVDGKIETWYQSTDPSTTSEWRNSGESKEEADNRHEGDIWYDTDDHTSYRWNGSSWLIYDGALPQELFDLVDGRAQVFLETPTVPYHVGDLWFGRETADFICDGSEWIELNEPIPPELYGTSNGAARSLYVYREAESARPSNTYGGTYWYAPDTGKLRYNTLSEGQYDTSFNLEHWNELPNSANAVSFLKKYSTYYTGSSRQIYLWSRETPYNNFTVKHPGDLWHRPGTDIMVCVTERLTGNYTASDWAKRDKYASADTVEQYHSEFLVENDRITSTVASFDGRMSTIEQTANDIVLKVDNKVSYGEVSIQLSGETHSVTIAAKRFFVDSEGFSIDGNNGSISCGTYSQATLSEGGLVFTQGGERKIALLPAIPTDYQGFNRGQWGLLETTGMTWSSPTPNGWIYHMAYSDTTTGVTGMGERLFVEGNIYCTGTVYSNGIAINPNPVVTPSYEGPYWYTTGVTVDNWSGAAWVTQSNLATLFNFACFGQKYRIVKTEHYGDVGMSALESATPTFADSGSGIIGESGYIDIYFDDKFAETIDTKCDYQVFITPTSEMNVHYVQKDCLCFRVYGEKGATFDWLVLCVQRDYTLYRMSSVIVDPRPESEDTSIFKEINQADGLTIEDMKYYQNKADEISQGE